MPRRSPAFRVFACLALIALAACTDEPRDLRLIGGAGAVDDARLANADADEENWLTNGRT